jgi:hypothetical protein
MAVDKAAGKGRDNGQSAVRFGCSGHTAELVPVAGFEPARLLKASGF